MNRFALSLLAVVSLFAMGCASIVNGRSQSMQVSSTPPGARIYDNGTFVGETPTVIQVKRKGEHTLLLEKEGLQSHEEHLGKRCSWWVAGNLLFGGLIGLAIDISTASLYTYDPDTLQVDLQEQGTESSSQLKSQETSSKESQ